MNKKLLLCLTLLLLLLIGCSSITQDEPQASPTVIVTETPVEMDDATTQDTEPTARQEVAAETPVEIEESATQDDGKALPQAFPPDVVAEIQAEMDALTAGTMPPGMVAWIDAPEYQFAGASGSANLMDDTPMSPEGAFRIGSITKMFTAVVIMQLAEDGVLTLDDSLTLWLPEVVEQLPYGDQITLRHLLTHTSGLFNVVEHEAYYADIFTEMVVDEATGNVTLDCVERDPNDTLARYVYGKEAQFEPGKQWRYSNTNYTLLGMIIETAAEMPLAEAYRTHIYEPLGMTSTFLDCYEEPVIDIVHGYTGAGDEMADVTELHESVGWSAGGLVSTAADLTTFARGLFGGALFDDPESLVAMTTAAPGSAYGLGVMLQGDYMGHAGYIAGFRSVLNYAPELDIVVVMLYNHDGADPEQSLADVLNPALPLLQAAQ
ncbi:MAG: beta-lactamase family protein [Anaerolineae bacterium]|nr:beta-lactamase family protein [Anaerolineae bacterium]MCO5195376.1 beta-lactamase family protein [Anaerolineae bacterium]